MRAHTLQSIYRLAQDADLPRWKVALMTLFVLRRRPTCRCAEHLGALWSISRANTSMVLNRLRESGLVYPNSERAPAQHAADKYPTRLRKMWLLTDRGLEAADRAFLEAYARAGKNVLEGSRLEGSTDKLTATD